MKNWKKAFLKGLFLNIGAEEQQNYYEQWGKERRYFRTKDKNKLDIGS